MVSEPRPELQVFLDAVLDKRADWQDFPSFLGSRPWVTDWLELERAARKVGLDPGISKGKPDDRGRCVVCGESFRAAATCHVCSRRWVCGNCLTAINEENYCPLCFDDYKYIRSEHTGKPLTWQPLADEIARLRDG